MSSFRKAICIFGANCSGKTHLLYTWKLGSSAPPTIPTIGFNLESLTVRDARNKKKKQTMIDVGGGSKIRPLYFHYLTPASLPKGVIFLIDAKFSCESELRFEAESVLRALHLNKKDSGAKCNLPCVFLFNFMPGDPRSSSVLRFRSMSERTLEKEKEEGDIEVEAKKEEVEGESEKTEKGEKPMDDVKEQEELEEQDSKQTVITREESDQERGQKMEEEEEETVQKEGKEAIDIRELEDTEVSLKDHKEDNVESHERSTAESKIQTEALHLNKKDSGAKCNLPCVFLFNFMPGDPRSSSVLRFRSMSERTLEKEKEEGDIEVEAKKEEVEGESEKTEKGEKPMDDVKEQEELEEQDSKQTVITREESDQERGQKMEEEEEETVQKEGKEAIDIRELEDTEVSLKDHKEDNVESHERSTAESKIQTESDSVKESFVDVDVDVDSHLEQKEPQTPTKNPFCSAVPDMISYEDLSTDDILDGGKSHFPKHLVPPQVSRPRSRSHSPALVPTSIPTISMDHIFEIIDITTFAMEGPTNTMHIYPFEDPLKVLNRIVRWFDSVNSMEQQR
ncbi:Small GTPase superfamily, ARF/SAR type like protein [Aduncisulcus paluster]|uniref:Small GTPase superfamily, ARF/SAR type like protein n=1 Tax=Aduncisulcus paluster TaxID=2918883 RepID=A0ABQ5K0M9_9EUKA|nr:Small GTPase superfamily, ARF/SAR type like protein [Aduncisulcus paluster]